MSNIGISASLLGLLFQLLLPVLIYTCIAVASEARWGRRGLLVSWLCCSAIFAILLVFATLWNAAFTFDVDTTGPLALAAVSGAVFFAPTFGASALLLRRVGAASSTPRALFVRIGGGTIAGIGGAVASQLVVLVTLLAIREMA